MKERGRDREVRMNGNDATARVSRRTVRRMATMALTGLVFFALMGGGIAVLHLRAGAVAVPDASPPITVAVQPVRLADGYTVTERFAGRLEPVRQTRLAFERPGLVIDVTVEEGDRVAEGAVIARLDTAKLEAERARLKAERGELVARQGLARVTLDRQRALASDGWQSKQRYDEARYTLAETSAAIERLDAAVASIDVDIRKSVLNAPYAGDVAARWIDEGAVVDAGTPVMEVLETGVRQVRIGVSVEAAQTLVAGRTYRLSAAGGEFRGRLISKRPDLQTGTRTVTVLLDAIGGEAVPFGDIVELMLERRVPAEGMWLPIRALTEGRKGIWSVLVVDNGDGEAVIAREAVEVLHVDDGRAFVRGTLSGGTAIVVGGTNRIIPGQRVALAALE